MDGISTSTQCRAPHLTDALQSEPCFRLPSLSKQVVNRTPFLSRSLLLVIFHDHVSLFSMNSCRRSSKSKFYFLSIWSFEREHLVIHDTSLRHSFSFIKFSYKNPNHQRFNVHFWPCCGTGRLQPGSGPTHINDPFSHIPSSIARHLTTSSLCFGYRTLLCITGYHTRKYTSASSNTRGGMFSTGPSNLTLPRDRFHIQCLTCMISMTGACPNPPQHTLGMIA